MKSLLLILAISLTITATAQQTFTAQVITPDHELQQMGAAPRQYSVAIAGSTNMVRLRVTILKNGQPWRNAWVAVDANRLPRAIVAGKLHQGQLVSVTMYQTEIAHSGDAFTGLPDWGPGIVGVVN